MKSLNFGVIGNCRSAALISETGSLDWLCLPQFDSSSVFARILDKNKGGSFEIHPKHLEKVSQFYIPRTNILTTRFECSDGIFELEDFMPRYNNTANNSYYIPPDVIRYFKLIEGEPKIVLAYQPQLEYAKYKTTSFVEDGYIKSQTVKGTYDSLYLYSSFNFQDILEGNAIT